MSEQAAIHVRKPTEKMLQRRKTAMQRFIFSHKWHKPATKSGQIKLVLTVVLLIILLTSSLAYSLLMLNQTNSNANGSVSNWQGRAEIAWKYFQPDIGVNRATGLSYASADWPEFTERDLSTYILAIINAERLGLIARDGPWGSDFRAEKILSFLENRPLTSNRLPCAIYSADTGAVADGTGNQTAASLSDAAFLLLALDDLRSFRPSLSNRISATVARCNYAFLAQGNFFADNDVYSFYLAQGFWAFGFSI
jgi:hypothetical protein